MNKIFILALLVFACSLVLTSDSSAQLPGIDTSGNGNDITTTGYNYVADQKGIAGAALYFDWGSPLEIPNSASWETPDYSVSTWVNIGSDEFGPNPTGKRTDYSLGAARWVMSTISTNGWSVGGAFSFSYYGVDYTSPVSLNAWHLFGMSVENNLITMYINGVSVGQTQASGENNSGTTRPIVIGGNGYSETEQTFNGAISDYMYYERALSPVEMSQIYSLQSVPEPSTYALLLLSGAASLWAFKRRKS